MNQVINQFGDMISSEVYNIIKLLDHNIMC